MNPPSPNRVFVKVWMICAVFWCACSPPTSESSADSVSADATVVVDGWVDETSSGADTLPEQDHTAADMPCVAQCEGRVCGPDGCGGTCGECAGTQDRCVDGVCVCTPKECIKDSCGPDGCGGWCGDCSAGTLCLFPAGQCVPVVEDCQGDFCRLPASTFIMGGIINSFAPGFDYDQPPHPVTITRPFAIQRTEVTRRQWLNVMAPAAGDPSLHTQCGLDCPVNRATLFDMAVYANRKSEAEGLSPCYQLDLCEPPQGDGYWLECQQLRFAGLDCPGYRLPTEAEWEYAARAGTTTCYPNGDPKEAEPNCEEKETVAGVGWFCGNSEVTYEGCAQCSSSWPGGASCCGVHPVAVKPANAFGLYDFHGNVREVTGTLFTPGQESKHEIDPGVDLLIDRAQEPSGVSVRGGGYSSHSFGCCSHARVGMLPIVHPKEVGFVGFRLVRTLPQGVLD